MSNDQDRKPQSAEPLPVVAWRWVPSRVWVDYVYSDEPEKRDLATQLLGPSAVEPLVRLSDATREIEKLRSALLDIEVFARSSRLTHSRDIQDWRDDIDHVEATARAAIHEGEKT